MKSEIQSIHATLVRPRKGKEQESAPSCKTVPLEGKLHEMLLGVFENSDTECNLDIRFVSTNQKNDARDLLCNYLETPNETNAQSIAQRLEASTTNRSGLALLFIIRGNCEQPNGSISKLVIARFPADQAILAEDDGKNLNVEFLEKVFLRNAFSYKSVVYRGLSKESNVWEGRAVDKQINDELTRSSQYWINAFLESDYLTTSSSGTRRFANILQDVPKATDNVDVQQEVIAASQLAENLDGKTMSGKDFLDRLNLSKEAKSVIEPELSKNHLLNENFQFSAAAFSNVIRYRWIGLKNGGVVIGPANNFEEIYTLTANEENGTTRITTESKIVEAKLRSVR